MQNIKPINYIKIAVANAYGLDKSTWNKRINFVNEMFNTNTVDECIACADEPVLMQKALNAYDDAINGIPTGFMANLDATASGLQIMACLIGCKKTAEATNLIFNGKRNNAYQYIADEMGSTLAITKKPTMTYFYGSKAEPKKAFGEDIDLFINALKEKLPGAYEVMEDNQSCWNPEAYEYEWTLPDGHTSIIKVMKTIQNKIEVDELDHATFTYQHEINEPMKKGVSLAANIIQSIDAYIARQMVSMAQEQGFELLTIHDSFWASPNHMQKVRQNYLNILMNIADSNLLQDILRQITNNPKLEYIKYCDNLSDYMKDSEYSLS